MRVFLSILLVLIIVECCWERRKSTERLKRRISGRTPSEYYNEAYLNGIQKMGGNDYKRISVCGCNNEYNMSPKNRKICLVPLVSSCIMWERMIVIINGGMRTSFLSSLWSLVFMLLWSVNIGIWLWFYTWCLIVLEGAASEDAALKRMHLHEGISHCRYQAFNFYDQACQLWWTLDVNLFMTYDCALLLGVVNLCKVRKISIGLLAYLCPWRWWFSHEV